VPPAGFLSTITFKEFFMPSAKQFHTAIQHTPGPWNCDMDFIVAPDPNRRHSDIYIAELAHSDDEGRIASPLQQDANRRLIAAAPELMECLQDILAVFNDAAANSAGTQAIISFFGKHEDAINQALSWRQRTRNPISKATAEPSQWRLA
jgi:hypothetical protein